MLERYLGLIISIILFAILLFGIGDHVGVVLVLVGGLIGIILLYLWDRAKGNK